MNTSTKQFLAPDIAHPVVHIPEVYLFPTLLEPSRRNNHKEEKLENDVPNTLYP